ncbi:GNAT family N-acetyltransferase [Hespellia stercorisuis]|uniref:Phosphinothricin acetyltransferase n=1 Tax=Hespellia stercorisuis DSM 15480 TaxID=1121950 RepID=A0A1M6N247_9FIRM|nr:GNAT family N-acetyltransferase [Hespellia stercorisuis]SHJ89738.1 phosphinothricin acetyltransferase [Hespellia stercorisuis DSM 15480]
MIDKGNFTVRMATEHDVDGIIEVYEPYVKETSITFEYDVPTVEEYVRRINRIQKKYPFLVAVIDEKIVGYAYASQLKNRAAYDWSVEVSIYVKEENQHHGIASTLYSFLETMLKQQNVVNLYACITYPNERSIGFHEYMGFHEAAHFNKCGYKQKKWHDVIWMEKELGDHNSEPFSFIPIDKISGGKRHDSE